MAEPGPLEIPYFSDVLCVWAYAGEVRLEELRRHFGDRVAVAPRFLGVYGNVPQRILDHCGGADDPNAAYAAKMHDVARRFEHTHMHADCFTKVVPFSSNQAHLVACAVRRLAADGELDDDGGTHMARLIWNVRRAFFEEARDVARLSVLFELLEAEGVPRAPIEARLADGSAMAELSGDLLLRDRLRIEGSPTYVLDGGRQKLFGNVGYRVIEANVSELLDSERGSRGASWC